MNQEMTLVVLAAGMGSRYGGLKQLDPVGPSGEVILDYSVFDARRAGFNKVVFVIRKDFEAEFRNGLGSHFENAIDIDYAFQDLDDLPKGFQRPNTRQKPWGTAHAVYAARNVVKSPFVVINADDFYGADSYEQIHRYLTEIQLSSQRELDHYAMVGFPLKNTLSEHGTVSRGLCECSPEGYLESVVEIIGIRKVEGGAEYTDSSEVTHPLSGEELVSMNLWGFTPSFFSHLEEALIRFLDENLHSEKAEFYIPTVIDHLIRANKAKTRVLSTSSQWFGITYREDKPVVVESIRQLTERNAYPTPLWEAD